MPKTQSDKLVFASQGDKEKLWGFSPNPAGALQSAYRLAEGSRVIRAARAIGCGIVALIAKDIVGHGEFQKWLGETLGFATSKKESLSFLNGKLRTARNYMAVARCFLEAREIVPGHLSRSRFLTWIIEGEAPDLESDKIWKAVTGYIGERSLWEIYQDEGIARERDPHQKHTPPKLNPEQQVQQQLELAFERADTIRTTVTVFAQDDETWGLLPKEKRLELIDATVPLLETLVLNTDWSPRELAAIIDRLVGINGRAREMARSSKPGNVTPLPAASAA